MKQNPKTNLAKYFSIIFLSLFLLACSENANKPEQVAKSFVEAFWTGNIKKVQSLGDEKDMIPQELNMYYAIIEDVGQGYKAGTYQIDRVAISNEKEVAKNLMLVNVEYTIILNYQKRTGSMEIPVIYSNNRWQVDLKKAYGIIWANYMNRSFFD